MICFQLFSNEPKMIALKQGEVLFAEGDPGHLMYVLTVGSAEVYVNGHVVDVLGPGNIVGEMGLVSPEPRSATVRATTDAMFVAVDEKRFHYLVQNAPNFAIQVIRVLAERLRNINNQIPVIEDI